MKLENSFTIDAPVDKAWEALNSPETVAPCFPGATLTSYEGDSFSGTVKVKLGPIAMTYKGKGTYVTRDEDAHEVVIDATGRDSRGNGTATAKVTASLAADGPDRTAVSMVTDMTITGKPAQFGRGVIADVADKIIGQFSACVARKLAPAEAGSGTTSEVEAPAADVSSSSPATSAGARSAASAGSAATTVAPVSEAEAPAADMTPSAPAEQTESGPASEAEAPAADTRSASPTTSAGARSAGGGTAATNGTSAATPEAVSSAAATAAPASPLRSAQAPIRSEVEAIDLFDTAGAPVLKRLVPAAGVGVFLLLVFLLVRRLRSS